MAGTYGAAGKNAYTIPNIVGFFSNEVNATNGVTQVYIQGTALTQKSVGTYNPQTGKFTPDQNSGLTQQQLKTISEPAGISAIKTSSVKVATEGIKATGVTQEEAQKKAQQLVTKNTASTNAPDANQNSDQQGANPREFNEVLSNLKIADKEGGVRQAYPNLKYPLNANFDSQDCIKFSMYRYKPKKVELSTDLGAFSGSNKGSSMGTVTLPIQPSISDSNAVRWGEDTLDSIQAAGSAAALSMIAKGSQGAEDAASKIREGVKSNKEDIAKLIASSFAGAATGANQSFLTRATGAVLNNNLELLFQGPALRSFTFNFSLSAREKDEAVAIKKIIRFFKQGMSVKRSSSELFLQTPNIFDITYLHKGKEHQYINKIKTCALQNCIVNYTPAGNYATYEDGAMTQYDISLTFSEIEPLFDDDYTKLDGDSDQFIGY